MPTCFPSSGKLQLPTFNSQYHLNINDDMLLDIDGGGNFTDLFSISSELFTQNPSLADIRQGGLGDCYFLSPLMAILSKANGGNYIVNIFARVMINGTPKICVRLFYKKPPAVDLEIYYIYLDTSIFVRKILFKDAFSLLHNSDLWIHYLEKAYFALYLYHRDQKIIGEYGDTKSFYEFIDEGGSEGKIFECITGKVSNQIYIKSPYSYKNRFDSDLTKLYLLMKLSISSLDAANSILYNIITTKSSCCISTYEETRGFISENRSIFKEITTKFTLCELDGWSKKLLTIFEDKEQVEKNSRIKLIYTNFLDFLEEAFSKYHPKRGFGEYSFEENVLYHKISQNLHVGDLLTCSASVVDRHNKGEHHGLLNSHAYAIVGFQEGHIRLPNDTTRRLKFLILANPQARHIRHYSWKLKNSQFVLTAKEGEKIKECSDPSENFFGELNFIGAIENLIPPFVLQNPEGVFGIELSDFMKRFDLYFSCSVVLI